MTIVTDTLKTGEYIVYEANGTRSRDVVAGVLGSTFLPAGTILGQLTADDTFVPYDEGASTGAEDVAGILFEGQSGTKDIVITARDTEVVLSKLTYTGTEATVVAGLKALGIITR